MSQGKGSSATINSRQCVQMKSIRKTTQKKRQTYRKSVDTPSCRRQCIYLQQLAFVGVGWLHVPFGEFIDLSPEVSVLLPDFVQLCFGLLGRAAGFETQPVGDGLFSTFRCHG